LTDINGITKEGIWKDGFGENEIPNEVNNQ